MVACLKDLLNEYAKSECRVRDLGQGPQVYGQSAVSVNRFADAVSQIAQETMNFVRMSDQRVTVLRP